MQVRNVFIILGIEPTDNMKIVKKAYFRKAFETHPDKNNADNATEMFQEISRAWEKVDDEEKLAT